MKGKFFILLLFAAFSLGYIIFAPHLVSAQTVTGTLQGRVVDSNNAAIPGATVVIRNVETGLERTIQTNDEGFYNAPFLPIGKYTVEATRSDFNKVVQENVTINLNDTTVVGIKLDPTVKGEVTITDEPPQINTTNAQISGSLTAQEITERPVLNQSSFLSLAETFSGYQENPNLGQNNPTLSSGSSVSFNGTGSRGTTFQINGVNNDDSSENQNRQGASLATIKEFQVITNNFTAEFGRGYGAVVLVQTLSGTNNLRGSAYIYHNNSALNAKSFYSHGKKPVNRRNQYGATVGFPFIKNRLFGFFSFDQTRNSGALGYTRDIFLPSERDPANWFKISPQNNTPENRAFIQSVIDRFPAATPNDPANRGPRAYVSELGYSYPNEDYSGRIDWNASQADTVFLRYQYTRQRTSFNEVVFGEYAEQNNKQQNVGLTWTHIFSPQLVGEFRYGLGLRTTLANIQAGNDTPVIRFFNNNRPVSGPIIGNAAAFPIQRYQTDNQFVYNISWVAGSKHFVKMGTDIRMQNLDDLADNASRGYYNFNSNFCNGVRYFDGFDAFLNGCVTNYQKGYGNFYLENRLGEYNLYAEDNWKIHPSLTLNLGVRYEYVNAPRELFNRIEYGYRDDKNNIAPRFGFAYSPSFDDGILGFLTGGPGKFSIRGGYGVFHGRLFQSIFAQTGASIRTNPPNAFYYNQTASTTAAGPSFKPTNLQDPTGGFVYVPGPDPVTGRLARNLLVDPNLEMPYTKQWNLSFERQLPWKTALRISYAGNRGNKFLRYSFGNAPRTDPAGVLVTDNPNNAPTAIYGLTFINSLPLNDPRRVDLRGQTLRQASDILCAGTGLGVPGATNYIAPTTACPNPVPIAANEYSLRLPRTTERRLNPLFNGYSEVSNTAATWYDALQVELAKRLSNGLSFQANYTWSKAMDTTSEPTSFTGGGDTNQTGNDLKASRALSRTHIPHRFTIFGTYRIPFFANENNFMGAVFGGWQISSTFRWAHGSPFSVVYTGVDLNLDNFSESRPSVVDTSVLGRTIADPNISQTLLPVSAFRPTTLADLGCCVLGRNTFYADGLKTVDFGLSKRFKMPFEGHNLDLRADFFNAFNHVQYGFPNVTWTSTSTSFGAINSTSNNYSPRNIQLSLKYNF